MYTVNKSTFSLDLNLFKSSLCLFREPVSQDLSLDVVLFSSFPTGQIWHSSISFQRNIIKKKATRAVELLWDNSLAEHDTVMYTKNIYKAAFFSCRTHSQCIYKLTLWSYHEEVTWIFSGCWEAVGLKLFLLLLYISIVIILKICWFLQVGFPATFPRVPL